MKLLENKIKNLQGKIANDDTIRIAIIGLGSVGNYLLTYLLSEYNNIQIFVLGRSVERMISDTNIARVAAGIRHNSYSTVKIIEIDLNNSNSIAAELSKINPDFIVNSSRAYSHLKYGSISWSNVRAYGIWTPLSIRYVKNIMEGIKLSGINPIVINTSYSDATNAWLKSAGLLYPDFGSGNLNHLIPRIKLAVAETQKISDVHNIDITIATSHFHDVLISKEGKTEGVYPLISAVYQNHVLALDYDSIYAKCSISMPSDEKRNMMNASSNFEIIHKIIDAIKYKQKEKIHSPGFCGMIGGYPIEIDFSQVDNSNIHLYDNFFSVDQMVNSNRESIYLDGVEDIANGFLVYSDELIYKTQKAFNYALPKKVEIVDSNAIADELIENVIKKFIK